MQVFQKDSKFWSFEQKQEVEKFFLFNSFLSKLYERRLFNKIVQLTYYARIQKGEQLILNYNKRPEVIIVLSGKIQVFKKNSLSPLKKSRSNTKRRAKSPESEFFSIGEYHKHSEVIPMLAQARITNVGVSDAEIIYVPASLYNCFIEQKKQQSYKSIHEILSRKFDMISKSAIKELSQSGCQFHEYTMNSIVFRAGDVAEYAYILLQGNVRIDRPNFAQKKQGIIILSPESMFGQSQLQATPKLRENTAVSCCAYSRVLVIPKLAFLNFVHASTVLPEIAIKMAKHFSNPQNSSNQIYKLSEGLKTKRTKLPELMRFRIGPSQSLQQEQESQYKLIRNSHRLLDAKPKKKSLRSKSALENYHMDPLKERIKLFEKIRPYKTKISIGNPFFDYQT